MKDFGLFQTANLRMINLLEAASSLATTGAPILISGEHGSGKSLLVQYLVSSAGLNSAVFKWNNCSQASAGDWIVVDGVEELNFYQQDELSQKVENFKQKNLAVRWLTTTNLSLAQLLQQNKIRKDLFYKLSVLQMEIPSLRHRPEDIRVLSKFFVQVFSLMRSQKICDLSQAALDRLQSHNWPGNIAELENVIERAVALNRGQMISEACIQFPQTLSATVEAVGTTLSEMEKKLILQTLQMTQQNKTRAAQILGISIRTLRNKLNEYREIGVI